MLQAIRREAVVGPGGAINVHAPELPEGTLAEVILLVKEPPTVQPPSLASMVGSGSGLFKSVEEVDRYIRELRDEWD